MKGLLKHLYIVSFLYIVCHLSTYSQSLPKIIPPAPETAKLFRFQDYPMDYSTGLPQISMPLYEVNSGSLSIPISISYHASGLQPNDQNGPIALGWSLNTGGMVSRTIYGSSDFGKDKFPFPFNPNQIVMYNDPNTENDIDILQQINHYADYEAPGKFKDSEYDVFSYSFGNTGGKFIFKDSNNSKTPVLIPYKPYVITPITSTALESLSGFEIIDDKGIYYRFIGQEFENTLSGSATGFLLNKIISADKADTITFTYNTFFQTRRTTSRDYIVDDANSQDAGNPPSFPDWAYNNPDAVENTTTTSYQIARIHEIVFRQGRVAFNLASGRDDIDNIQIYNNQNQVVKSIEFKSTMLSSTFGSTIPLRKLDSLLIKSSNSDKVMKHGFEYFPVIYPTSEQVLDGHFIDYWGYYNASGQRAMVPFTTINFIGIIGQSSTITAGETSAETRKPNLNGLKSGMLKKITYPTGGSTEFIYENNKYKSLLDNAIYSGPGLRVAQIINTDGSGSFTYKTYKYGIDECGYSFLDIEPEPSLMVSELKYKYLDGAGCNFSPIARGQFRRRIYHAGFAPSVAVAGQRPILYSEVTEYHGTQATHTGKTIYTYDFSQWGTGGMAQSVRHIPSFNYLDPAVLTGKVDYKAITSTQFVKVKSSTNYYAKTVTEDVKGLHVARAYNFPQKTGGVPVYCGYTDGDHSNFEKWTLLQTDNQSTQIYLFAEYKIPAGYRNLTLSIDSLFQANGTALVTTTSYEYNTKQFIAKTITYGSDNSQLISETKYPFEFTQNTVLTQMSGLNMLAYPTEQNEYTNTNPTKSVRTNYVNWGITNPMFAPQTVDVKYRNNSYETRLRYLAYDKQGQILNISQEDGPSIVYLWGYNSTYPLAEIKNATLSAVLSALGLTQTQLESNAASASPSTNYLSKINDLRSQLTGAMITTYTYQPLVGVISSTDANGVSTFYEYDGLQRLSAIRDKDGNLLKSYQYHYKQ